MNNINDISVVKRQYAAANNLTTRISIHDKYSTNKIGFGNWLVSNYRIESGMKVLELGCGTGDMWRNRETLIKSLSKLVLSDISEGMIHMAKTNVGMHGNIEYCVADIRNIPFEDGIFDAVIANMMLYHVPDIHKGLTEVRRVLKQGGFFYCATYGEHGIMEYLSKMFAVYGVKDNINKSFTLQNGAGILSKIFSKAEKLEYADSLEVTDISDMVEYIYSLSGMSALSDVPREKIHDILAQNTSDGILYVPKEYGMFIAS